MLRQVDLTPPTMGNVYHGSRDATPTNTSTCGTAFKLTWDAAIDTESGVSAYLVSVGTSAGGTDVVNERPVSGVDLGGAPGDPDIRPSAAVDVSGIVSGTT